MSWEKQKGVECLKWKPWLIEKGLGEVPLTTKMPRLNASLPTNAGSKKEGKNPTLATLLQPPKSGGNGVNHEGCNLWMLYLIWKNTSGAVFKNSWILVYKASWGLILFKQIPLCKPHNYLKSMENCQYRINDMHANIRFFL